jgi:hypothetical protein
MNDKGLRQIGDIVLGPLLDRDFVLQLREDKFEESYCKKLNEKYGFNDRMAKEIISYCRLINQGLLIYWFSDRVAEYLAKHSPRDEVAARDLIKVFHTKFVVPFGK